jgi:hypothetical protein
LYLTPDEADQFGKQFDALCRPFISRRLDPADRDRDARPVELTLFLVPLARTATGA